VVITFLFFIDIFILCSRTTSARWIVTSDRHFSSTFFWHYAARHYFRPHVYVPTTPCVGSTRSIDFYDFCQLSIQEAQ
jgi:hypothetical protein